VVAVPNTNRRRDLTPTHTLLDGEGNEQALFAATGRGDKFLQFFREQLFPEVESKYRTIPHRTIVGNSLGGLLALHAMVQSPDLFQGYIANDPSLWWDDQYVLRQAKKAIAPDRQSVRSV
ncbi:MAG: alpha/beta hydrolase, partial [Gammaproteobacteria bacterium]